MTGTTAIPRARGRRRNLAAYLFVLPYGIFLVGIGFLPTAYALTLSFFDTTGKTNIFNGLENWKLVLSDYRLVQSVIHVLSFVGIWLPMMAFCVILMAVLLHARPGWFSTTMRMVYYLPGAIVGTTAVLLWLFMFDPSISPFGILLHAVGLTDTYSVLSAPRLPLAFALMSFFSSAGGWVVVLYGALNSIPKEILEAAEIDGCTALQMVLKIKLPMIAKNVVFMLILSFSGGFQLFIEPNLISTSTSGAIATSDWAVNQISYIYAFTLLNFGAAAALSSCLLALSLAVALWLIYRTDFYRIDV